MKHSQSMQLICSADWTLDDAAKEWLPRHIHDVFNEVAAIVNLLRQMRGESRHDNWWDIFGDVPLTVRLHEGPTADLEGTLRSGLYWPGDNAIDIDWKLNEREPWREILHHEMQHFFGEQLSGFDWGEYGHGGPKDPLRVALQEILDGMYHGDLMLVHISER